MRRTIALLLASCASAALAQENENITCRPVTFIGQMCEATTPEPVPPEPEPEPPPSENPAKNAGAKLPIQDPVDSWGGTPRFVAPTGAGSKCTEAEPCAKISDAQNVAANGDPIVVRGGVYRNHGNTWNGSSWGYEQYITKPGVKVVAYPGEIPIFDGSQNLTSWTAEGSYKYAAYQGMPCGNGFGATFCTEGSADNLNGTDTVAPYNVGKWPDQVWVDDVVFQEVAKKADLASGKFHVDRGNNRLYLMASDVDGADVIAASKLGDWLTCTDAPDVTIKGLHVRRYSNSRARAAVTDIGPGCDRFQIEHVNFEDNNDMAMFLQGVKDNLLEDTVVRNVTITGSNWVGMNPLYTMRQVVDGIVVTGIDKWDEFSGSPTSGAMKTSRTWYGKMLNSYIADNKSQGVWFDQSNYDWIFAGNTVINNLNSCLFWEISDKLLMVNNYINCTGANPVKIAGSSGVTAWFNTAIGGKDAWGWYVDNRSILTCASTGTIASSGAACPGYSSDRWTLTNPPLPDTLDWLTRVDVMKGNIVGYPTANGYCGEKAAMCITRQNQQANVPLATVIHKADANRPQTQMDCNVYAVTSGSVIRHAHPSSSSMVGYATAKEFGAAMAGASPFPDIDGLEANSLTGADLVAPDGKPTDKLDHAAMACPYPTDPVLNEYAPAGTKHFGVLWQ